MLIRQNLSAAEQPASIIDEAVIGRAKHVHIHLGQIQLLKQHAPLISLVKPDALALGDLVPAGALPLLSLLVGHMIGNADLRDIIHLFRTDLYLHIAVGAAVKEGDMQGLILRPVLIGDVIPVIILVILIQKRRIAPFYAAGHLSREAALCEEAGQHIRDLIEAFQLFLRLILSLLHMTLRHGYDDAVGDQVTELDQTLPQLLHRRVFAVCHIVLVAVLDNIAVEFFLSPDQGFDAALEGKGQPGVLSGHIHIKLPDFLGLGGQEFIVLQQIDNALQEITVNHVDLIAGQRSVTPQIPFVFLQYPHHRVAGIQIVV